MTDLSHRRRPWREPGVWAWTTGALVLAAFVIAFAARPAIVLTTAGYDDGLFIALGHSLAVGHWLGPYNDLTLVKGPGFPAFLAIANVLGLPFPLALALFYGGCASFAAIVAGRVARSRWAALGLLIGLLFVPTLADGEMTRVYREVFYGGLVVAFASAAIALTTGAFNRFRLLAAVTGILAAWAWLTREEGVWLLPLAVLVLIPALRRHVGDGSPMRALAGRVKPAGLALAVAIAAVVGFGLLNWAVYGRFVVNELKDGPFRSALAALQDASAPYHQTGVPVPGAARARIYAVSPAFAELKEPTLDGPLRMAATEAGCAENKAYCGEFGGGWFLWTVRTTAARKGHHGSASEAARFYGQIAQEVRGACKDGRLTCGHWRIPLVPPMTGDEIDDVARSFGRVADMVTFGARPNTHQRESDFTGPHAARMVGFLNLPAWDQAGRLRMQGWYRNADAGWFSLSGQGATILAFSRTESPDVAAAFKDPRLSRHRFRLDVQCSSASACPVIFTPDGGAPVTLDLAKVAHGTNQIAGGELFFDAAGDEKVAPLLKSRLSQAWVRASASLSPVYRGLTVIGLLAYLALVVTAVRRRELSAPVVIGAALLLAVAARTTILALIDALSFRATSNAYAFPGMLLLVMFSLYALGALWTARRSAKTP